MNICGICAYYRKGGYCFKKHRDIGYMMTQPCFESKPIQENIVEPIKSNRMETKVCKHCGKELPIDQFATFRGKPTCICKECKRKSAIEGGRNRQKQISSRAEQRHPAPPKTKDNKLTWEDIKQIMDIADDLMETKTKRDLLLMGQQGFYTMVMMKWAELRRPISE